MTLREAEANSICAFLEAAGNAGLYSGRVLDYGCGKMPYRELIESFGADYTGYDRVEFPANVSGEDVGERHPFQYWYDTVVCTQVVQYADHVGDFLYDLTTQVKRGGHLVVTYPTHWPEVEREDLWRFTRAGMERLLTDRGFTVVENVPRHSTKLPGGEVLVHGYGVIAQA